jgi:hypothetical protein
MIVIKSLPFWGRFGGGFSYRQLVTPSVVAMAVRTDITIWMMSFQDSRLNIVVLKLGVLSVAPLGESAPFRVERGIRN